MKKFKWLKYIKVQIALYYLLTSIVLISVFGIALYYSIANIVLNETLETTISAVERSGNYVEVYIDKLKAIAQIIAENPSTTAYLGEHDDAKHDDVLALINSAIGSDAYIESIIMVSKDGRILSNEAQLDMTMSEDMMNESWYVSAINSDMPVLTSARMQDFSMDKEHWVISISQEVTDAEGNNIGVLLLDIKYLVLESYIDNLNLGDEGFLFILNDANEVVYHKDTSYFTDPDKQAALVEMVAMDGYDKDMDMLTHPYHLQNADWTLVGVSSLDGLQVIRRQMVEILVFVGLILLVIVIGSGIFIAGKITNPIKKLEEAMKDINLELKAVEIDTMGSYEATSLAIQFNKMLKRIESLLAEISEKEKYLRTYELTALHSQINPHFLYNTLDTIVWMAEFNDSEKVIAITKSLAQFFRLSLSQGEEMITLANEIDHVKQYLFIQKQRYAEKLNYSFDIDETVLEVKVPKIILQPIVENAIYHAIRELDRPGHIEVSAKIVDETIILAITDDGDGFDTKLLQSDKPSTKVKLGGVGLNNVNKRIQLYYGEMFGLEIDSEIGKGTVVRIRIPKNKK